MAEHQVTVSVKLPPEVVSLLLDELDHWNPAISGRSAMSRVLVEIGLKAFRLGIIKRNPKSLRAFLERAERTGDVLTGRRGSSGL